MRFSSCPLRRGAFQECLHSAIIPDSWFNSCQNKSVLITENSQSKGSFLTGKLRCLLPTDFVELSIKSHPSDIFMTLTAVYLCRPLYAVSPQLPLAVKWQLHHAFLVRCQFVSGRLLFVSDTLLHCRLGCRLLTGRAAWYQTFNSPAGRSVEVLCSWFVE